MSMGLTPRQADLLAFIRKSQNWPTLQEMAAALGLKAKSRAYYLLRGLEERGAIVAVGFGLYDILPSSPPPKPTEFAPPLPVDPTKRIAHLMLASGRINEDDRINWPNRLPPVGKGS